MAEIFAAAWALTCAGPRGRFAQRPMTSGQSLSAWQTGPAFSQTAAPYPLCSFRGLHTGVLQGKPRLGDVPLFGGVLFT